MYNAISESGRNSCADRAPFLAPSLGLILRPGRHGARRGIAVVFGRRGRRGLPLLVTTGNRCCGLLGVLGAIRAMHGRKPPTPSYGLVIQVDSELRVVDASQCLECLVKELIGPRLDALILGPKEGSNGYEGREERYEVPGHNWRFRQFDARFRMGKEAVKRTEKEAFHVVQGCHAEFTHALP